MKHITDQEIMSPLIQRRDDLVSYQKMLRALIIKTDHELSVLNQQIEKIQKPQITVHRELGGWKAPKTNFGLIRKLVMLARRNKNKVQVSVIGRQWFDSGKYAYKSNRSATATVYMTCKNHPEIFEHIDPGVFRVKTYVSV